MNKVVDVQIEDYCKPTPFVRYYANKMAGFFRTRRGKYVLLFITVAIMVAILVLATLVLVAIMKYAFGI